VGNRCDNILLVHINDFFKTVPIFQLTTDSGILRITALIVYKMDQIQTLANTGCNNRNSKLLQSKLLPSIAEEREAKSFGEGKACLGGCGANSCVRFPTTALNCL
jgi:hypothetical protein